ncbi:unnamed protein product [Candidula unifasciata]|uniref:Uncharacterized protein n=1 Tax=Candidula unifasciata TaxID=100452 RepID=A0A8S3YT30_9EUPU|nr:unnamed protein product [Candidula unifasciata]
MTYYNQPGARLLSCSKCLFLLSGVLFVIFLIHRYLSSLPVCRVSGPREWIADGYRNYAIRTTWNGDCIKHEPVKISLAPSSDGGMIITVLAPFFNSPPKPNGPAGQPFPGLWDYEVVEAFFLNDKNQYLEVELCPHGQHLLLMLNGQRKMVKDKLPLTSFNATIDGDRWKGEAILPRSYFPPGVTKFNAYAIHGEGSDRTYEALYPATWKLDQPDFHRLEFFQPIDMTQVLNNYKNNEVSELWRPFVTN